jgi:hypothetical protein
MIDFDQKPIAFQSEREARDHATNNLRDVNLSIIHSPHANNQNGDFFITEPCTIIRRWETLLFEGASKDAR